MKIHESKYGDSPLNFRYWPEPATRKSKTGQLAPARGGGGGARD